MARVIGTFGGDSRLLLATIFAGIFELTTIAAILDLIVNASRLDRTTEVVYRYFSPEDCEVVEGCVRSPGYGSGKLIEGTLKAGERVMVIEDVLTTGGQVLEAVKSLEGAGAKVEGIVGVLDRQEGARQNIESAGYKFDALFTTADLGIQ